MSSTPKNSFLPFSLSFFGSSTPKANGQPNQSNNSPFDLKANNHTSSPKASAVNHSPNDSRESVLQKNYDSLESRYQDLKIRHQKLLDHLQTKDNEASKETDALRFKLEETRAQVRKLEDTNLDYKYQIEVYKRKERELNEQIESLREALKKNQPKPQSSSSHPRSRKPSTMNNLACFDFKNNGASPISTDAFDSSICQYLEDQEQQLPKQNFMAMSVLQGVVVQEKEELMSNMKKMARSEYIKSLSNLEVENKFLEKNGQRAIHHVRQPGKSRIDLAKITSLNLEEIITEESFSPLTPIESGEEKSPPVIPVPKLQIGKGEAPVTRRCSLISEDPKCSYFRDYKNKSFVDLNKFNTLTQNIVSLAFKPEITLPINPSQTYRSEICTPMTKRTMYEDNSPEGLKKSSFIRYTSRQKTLLSPNKTHRSVAAMVEAPKEKKLFEDFFILGPSQEDMETFIKQNSDKSKGTLSAKILSSYPSHISASNEAPRASIPDFTFPFGAEIKRIKSTPSFSGLNPYTSPLKSDYEQRSRCFAFPLLSKNFDAPEEPDSVWGEVIQASNPDKLLYIICINFKDFVTMSDNGQDKKSLSRVKYWEVNKAMCFMTYYPFTSFFFDILMKILNLLKVERMVKMTEMNPTDLDRHESVDMKFTSNYFENVIKKNLGTLLSEKIPTFGALLNFKLLGSFAETQIEYKLDSEKLAYTYEVGWACTVVFRYITYKDLLWFYTALLLERKLVFLTSNIHLLTAILFVLKSLIKPFSYPFPLIFNLPEVLTVYCDAPGAALIGINKGEEYLKEQDLFEQYPSCIFVCLDEEKVYFAPENNVQTVTFNNFERPLITLYSKLNSNFNRTIMEAKKSSKRITNKHESIKLTEDFEERERSFKILELFKENLEKKLLSFIPAKPIYKRAKELDYEEIGKIIMAKAKDVDKKFLKEFLQTQIWAYYVEMYYADRQ